jgi:RHS repeat-associated protein
VLREYSSDSDFWKIERDYIYRSGQLLAAETPEGRRHFHLDHLGTPRLITAPNGSRVAYHVYFPFGEEATDPFQDQERMKFTGHERDLANPNGTGDDLDYMHARFCSPVTGRFTSVDPIHSSALRVPQSWNKFSYALNNPVSFTDPKGLAVAVLDNQALELIQLTLPEAIRNKVILDDSGLISKDAINSIESDDANFLALKVLVNSDKLLEASTGTEFGEAGATKYPFSFKPVEVVLAEVAALIGMEAAKENVKGPELFLGGFNPPEESTTGHAQVVVSDGTGAATSAPLVERVVTMAHEAYGHGLLYIKGKPFRHDSGGFVDRTIQDIQERTGRRFQ